MIVYTQNPKYTTRKPVDFINEFGDITVYRVNTHKSVAFLYTSNRISEREPKQIILFSIA